MKILFLTESREDYLADSLLHGLISLGCDVVDYPKKDILYRPVATVQTASDCRVRGCGFTLYGLLENRLVDRSCVIQRLQSKSFDLVILGQVWRQWGQLNDIAPLLKDIPVVLLDGDDDDRIFYQSGTRIRRYGLHLFPIRSKRCVYLKRELCSLPLASPFCRVEPTSFSIPFQKLIPLNSTPKSQLFATHCVDPEVASAFGLKESYAFSSETEYYDDLARSWFAITTKRGGWDCLRHYEIAAAGALMCFRRLNLKPHLCAPHGLSHMQNCLIYQDYNDLKSQTMLLRKDLATYQRILSRSRTWILSHLTISVAQRLLDIAGNL